MKAPMAGKKTADKAVGRTRGGWNTKLHAVVDGLGNPVEFLLSAGNDHDSVHAVELLEKVRIRGSAVLADRAYGARAIREYISAHGASYVIPPQSNVSNPWPVDWHLYKERHLVECFSRKSSGFAESPPDMTSRMLPSWPLCILPPSLFCCFSTISTFFRTSPRRPSGCLLCYALFDPSKIFTTPHISDLTFNS